MSMTSGTGGGGRVTICVGCNRKTEDSTSEDREVLKHCGHGGTKGKTIWLWEAVIRSGKLSNRTAMRGRKENRDLE